MTISVHAANGKLHVKTPFSADNVARCQRVQLAVGGNWNKDARTWIFPDSPFTWTALHVEFGLNAPETPPPAEMPYKDFQPWQHQHDAFAFAYNRPATLLAHDMGCGKSMTAVALCNAWQARRVLVMCPLAVVPVWPKQFAMHSPQPWNVLELGNGASVARRMEQAAKALFLDVPTAIVLNYEAVWRKPFGEWALAQQWDVVIGDECHRLKAVGGKASRFAARLRDRATHRLGLTGTPLAHSPLDAYGVCRALDAAVFGTSYARFKARWAVMGGYQNYQFLRLSDPEGFSRRLGSIMHRVQKRDVLDLPPVVHEQRYCILSGESKRVYAEMARDFVTWVKAGVQVTAANALTKLLRLQQITGGYVGGDGGKTHKVGQDKLNAFCEFLDDLPAGEPLVVFCRFVADAHAIYAACAERGRTPRYLTGFSNELAQWQDGEGDVLVTQIQCGSEGVDLTRAATCAFYSLGFSLAQYSQALARLDRPGQTRSVTYVHLLAKDTVDERVMSALEKRQEVVEAILAGTNF